MLREAEEGIKGDLSRFKRIKEILKKRSNFFFQRLKDSLEPKRAGGCLRRKKNPTFFQHQTIRTKGIDCTLAIKIRYVFHLIKFQKLL